MKEVHVVGLSMSRLGVVYDVKSQGSESPSFHSLRQVPNSCVEFQPLELLRRKWAGFSWVSSKFMHACMHEVMHDYI